MSWASAVQNVFGLAAAAAAGGGVAARNLSLYASFELYVRLYEDRHCH